VSVTPANVSEFKHFEKATEGVETSRYYADKGVASAKKVEQAFGTMKRRFKFTRASYFGNEKVLGQCILKAIAFNLLKAINIA